MPVQHYHVQIQVYILLSLTDIARWSSSEVPNPAKLGTGVLSLSEPSWFVGRVNGGFMITRSYELSFAVTEYPCV